MELAGIMDRYDRERRKQEAIVGIDLQLLYREDDKPARVLAKLGRKHNYGLSEEHIRDYEKHEEEAALHIAQLKMYTNFLLGWKPDTIEQAQESMMYVEDLIQEYCDKFIRYGQRMLLSQILADAGEYLELEDS